LISVVISYSHKDESYKDELVTHLAGLRRTGVITDWHDRRLTAGSEIDPSLQERFETDAVILLLVSADYINSEYCWQKEMVIAMRRHDAGQARVIPIIVRPCDWKIDPISKLLAAPKDGKPVSSWPDRDSAWLDVVQSIRSAIVEIARAAARKAAAESNLAPMAVAAAAVTPVADRAPVQAVAAAGVQETVAVAVEWKGMAYLMGYQVKVKFDDGESQSGSFNHGFSLNFLLPRGPHKMTLSVVLSAVAKVQPVEKLFDKVAQDFPVYFDRPGPYRVVLGFKMFKGLVISEIAGP
jgi:hypothetical protein